MKTFLALLVGLMIALAIYTVSQDYRAQKIESLAVLDPSKAVPQTAVLKVLIWEEYIPPEVYERLRIEKGIAVQLKTFKSDEEFVRILDAGEQFDLTMPSDYIAHRLDRLQLSLDIDYSHIPNHRNLIAGLRRSEQMVDLFRCSVPFIFGTVALGYNAQYVGELPLRWSALFDPTTPEALRGRMAIIDDPRLSLGIALLAQGKSPNTRNLTEIRAAGDLIIRSMSHLTRLGNYDLEGRLREESLFLTMIWGGDVARALETNKAMRFIGPDEGSLLYFDCFVIMRGTQQQAAAEAFIDFILQPHISAQIANHSFSATLNEAATPYVSRVLLNGPAYYFPRGRQLYYREDLRDAERLYADVWRDVRAYFLARVKPSLDAEISFSGKFIAGNDRPHATPPALPVNRSTRVRVNIGDPAPAK